TTIAVFLTRGLTQKATTADIARGKDPLPPGSPPQTDGPPINVTPTGNPLPPPPTPAPLSPNTLLNMANQVAQGVAIQANPKCPDGMHAVPNKDPNTQWNVPYWCVPNL